MMRDKTRRFYLSILIFLIALLFTSSIYAVEYQSYDPKKVKRLTGTEKMAKSDVEKLFGKPVTSTPMKKTDKGCIELWIYTEVVMDGFTPIKTEFLYVGFDEKGYVCSAEVTI